jgi:cyanate lyase
MKAFENFKNHYYEQDEEITLPIAKEIVSILNKKKISYAQAQEALDIAKEWVGELTISEADLPQASTKELVNELMKREGVETKIAEPYKDEEIKVNGPAIVLTVID